MSVLSPAGLDEWMGGWLVGMFLLFREGSKGCR